MTVVKTRIKQFPLDDETLETPEHDEMVLWLLDKNNLCKIFPRIKHLLTRSPTIYMGGKCTFIKLLEKVIHPEFLTEHNIWPLLTNNETLNQTFINFCITESEKKGKIITQDEIKEAWTSLCNHLAVARDKYENELIKISIDSEVPITSGNNYVIGFWDVVINIDRCLSCTSENYNKDVEIELRSTHSDGLRYYIEVKPKITSFGKTLRQINLYNTYINNDSYKIILVTKDSRFKEAFESQNIMVKIFPEEKTETVK